VNFDLSKADIELVVDVLRIDEVSEAFDCLRSETEGCWEDMVVGLRSNMEGSKMYLLLKGVGRSGSDGTVCDVVWRVELGMEEAVASLYVLFADVTLATTMVR